MKLNRLFIFFLLLLTGSCSENEEPAISEEVSYIQNVSFNECSNHEVIDMGDFGLSSIRDFVKWNDLYLFDNIDKLVVRTGGVDGTTIINEEMEVRKFFPMDSRILIAAFEGLFAIDKDGTMSRLLYSSCGDIELAPDGSVILGVAADYFGFILAKLNEDDNSVTPYTDTYDSDWNCIPFRDIVFMGDNDIFASTCDGYVVHFRDRMFVESFGKDDMGLPGVPASTQFFIAPHDDDLIVVAKNGASFYYILKYTQEGEWIKLKTFQGGSILSEKDTYMFSPSITDALILEDNLYVSTTIAGCRGIQEYNVSKNEELADDDYRVIQDPNLPSQCIEKLIVDEAGNLTILTSHSQIINLDCN